MGTYAMKDFERDGIKFRVTLTQDVDCGRPEENDEGMSPAQMEAFDAGNWWYCFLEVRVVGAQFVAGLGCVEDGYFPVDTWLRDDENGQPVYSEAESKRLNPMEENDYLDDLCAEALEGAKAEVRELAQSLGLVMA